VYDLLDLIGPHSPALQPQKYAKLKGMLYSLSHAVYLLGNKCIS
jgi:hypothetical protein